MIRPMTCLSLVAALGAGMYLYQVKHNAQMLDRDINRTIKQAGESRDRIGLLKAEWALLNEPERLQTLATLHLPQLQSLQPTQFARLEDLASRLPGVSTAPVEAAPVEDTPITAIQPMPPFASNPPAAMTPPRGPAMAQAVPAAPLATTIKPLPATPPLLMAAAHVAPKPHPLLAKPHEADAAPAAYTPVPAPRPYYAPVMPAYAPTPVVIHAPTVQVASAVAPTPPSAPYVGWALGMARTMLSAPVPVASAAPMGYASAR